MHFTAYLERNYRSVDRKNPGKGKSFFLLFTFLFLTFCLQAQTIELHLKKASLANVFKKVEAQSSYRFIYTREEVEAARPISGTISGGTIKEVLELIFRDQPLTYLQEGNYIRVVQKPMEAAPKGIDVTGRVINEKGEGLPGASVQVRGSVNATATNAAGEFYLQDIQASDVLIISSIGYSPAQIALHGNTNVQVRLDLLVSSLDETVVIAYGTTTRRLNTGSVGRVTSKEIGRQPVSNPIAALQGRVSGLFITQGNGLPGSNFSVLIRGRNSIQNGTAPLYIIDGVPFLSNEDRLTQRSGLNANNPFNTIPPGDIESIEVLKDADATAIYGSRGANGVILITTKKPKNNQTGVDVQFYTGIGRPTRTLKFMNTVQYLEMRREAFQNDGITPDMTTAPDLLEWDTTRNVNWQKVLMGETARTTNAGITFNGGNAQTRFSLSSNYYKETTVFPGDFGNQRSAVNLTLNHQSSSKKLEAALVAGYASDNSTLPLQNLGQYITISPNAMDIYDANGRLNWSEGAAYFSNPVALLQQQYKGLTNRLTSNLTLQYHLTSNLQLKTSIGYNDVRFDERSITPISSLNPAGNPKGEANFGNNSIKSWILEPQAIYHQKIGKQGTLQSLAGLTFQQSMNYSSLMRGTNYTNDALLKSTAGAGNITSTNAQSTYKYNGVFGRLHYSLRDRYLVNLTGRRDGSSRFGPGHQFANFGAIGAGWIFSKETWIQKLLPMLSFGKARASYGITGSDQINNYQYFDTWSATQYPYSGGLGFRPSRLFNPDYSWEQIRKLEAALELGFLHDRFFLSAGWFNNTSDNQIIGYSLPTQTGFNTVLRNFPGRVENKGWELETRVVPVLNKRLAWTISANLTIPRNQLLSFPGLESSSYATRYMIGKPLNMQMGYHFLGVDPQTGSYTFEDVNKNGKTDWDRSDFIYTGTADPKYYGGLQQTLLFKGLEASIFFEFRKQKGLDPIYNSGTLNGTLLNRPVAVMDRWQKEGDVARFERYSQNFNNPLYEAAYFLANSDGILTDASFIRLKNAALSYSLPGSWLKKGIRKCRVFVQGQNLATFTRYVGADPENQSVVGLSPLKILSGGIQVTF